MPTIKIINYKDEDINIEMYRINVPIDITLQYQPSKPSKPSKSNKPINLCEKIIKKFRKKKNKSLVINNKNLPKREYNSKSFCDVYVEYYIDPISKWVKKRLEESGKYLVLEDKDPGCFLCGIKKSECSNKHYCDRLERVMQAITWFK